MRRAFGQPPNLPVWPVFVGAVLLGGLMYGTWRLVRWVDEN